MLIAHLSDLHLKGQPDRRARILSALVQARTYRPDHLVLTGDLTASGKMTQMIELGHILAEAGWEKVTLIPGNHDAGGAFDAALQGGVLGRFEQFSKGVVPLKKDGAVFGRLIALDTRYRRRALAFSALGLVGASQFRALEEAMLEGGISRLPTLIAMHHGPQYHPLGLFDGLVDRRSFLAFLKRHSQAHVLAGHDHRVLDIGTIHVAASAAHHGDPLRLYRLGRGGSFEIVYRSSERGSYLSFGRGIE
jgi:3',5'-cyclic AMP phosphodiesterase CpdA